MIKRLKIRLALCFAIIGNVLRIMSWWPYLESPWHNQASGKIQVQIEVKLEIKDSLWDEFRNKRNKSKPSFLVAYCDPKLRYRMRTLRFCNISISTSQSRNPPFYTDLCSFCFCLRSSSSNMVSCCRNWNLSWIQLMEVEKFARTRWIP